MKKYTSTEQIERDIDKAYAKIAKAKEVAQGYLDEEQLLIGGTDVSELRDVREKADFQFRKIKRLEDVRLPKLKSALAEFNTLTLPLPDTAPDSVSPPV